jgi:hypothetical protein
MKTKVLSGRPKDSPKWQGCLTILAVLFILTMILPCLVRISFILGTFQKYGATDLKPYSSTYLYGRRSAK